MSSLLMRKAFELFDKDSDKAKKDVKKPQKKVKESLSTRKYGLKKEKLKLQRMSAKSNDVKARNMDKKIKSVIDEYRKKQIKDHTEDNLHVLRRLSDLKPKSIAAHKIIEHHVKTLSKNKVESIEDEQSEPKSILFPEENVSKKRKRKH